MPGDAPLDIAFVRPEYAMLANEFALLAAEFDHDVDHALRHDIARLASSIEHIDRFVDELPDAAERLALWQGILRVLDGEDVHLPEALARATRDLRALGEERHVCDRIRRIVAKEVPTSETIRYTTSARRFVEAVLREGRLTAALALVVAGPACGRPFRKFFFRLAGPANLVDKLLDVRGDHARGEMALPPTMRLHVRLAGELLVRAAALVPSHPRPWRLALLGWRYLGPDRARSGVADVGAELDLAPRECAAAAGH
jgi:hypothetical protein